MKAAYTFQLTPSRRATPTPRSAPSSRRNFNSRPHGGRRYIAAGYITISTYFNSRPHGGRHLQIMLCNERINFNSRPHGGRQFPVPDTRHHFLNFNSRPHGGRRERNLPTQILQIISTHALTEGDICRRCSKNLLGHFNSRPHGGRHRSPELRTARENFNSRSHGGRRFPGSCTPSQRIFQLTPSRRATTPLYITSLSSIYFNSRPHGGRPRRNLTP